MQIRAAVRSVWCGENCPQRHTHQPAVLLFVATNRSVSVRDCLVRRLANAAVKAQSLRGDPLDVNWDDFGGNEHDVLMSILRKIDRSIRESNLRVFILRDIDRIPAAAAAFLHSYCDATDAPFKDALIFLTISVSSIENHSAIQSQTEIERHLLDSWLRVGLNEEKGAALLSRVASNVIIVDEEARFLSC